jgi:hypothetical protein
MSTPYTYCDRLEDILHEQLDDLFHHRRHMLNKECPQPCMECEKNKIIMEILLSVFKEPEPSVIIKDS